MPDTKPTSRIHPGPGLLFLTLAGLLFLLGFWTVYAGPALKKRQVQAEAAGLAKWLHGRGQCNLYSTRHPLFKSGRFDLKRPDNLYLQILFGRLQTAVTDWQHEGGVPELRLEIDCSRLSREENHELISRLGRFPRGQLACRRISDADARDMEGLPKDWYLQISEANLSVTGIRRLSEFGNVAALGFGPRMGDAELQALRPMTLLYLLDLSGSAVTDAGMKGLVPLPRLRQLSLSRTAVTDTGIQELSKMPSLGALDLSETTVTDKGLIKASPSIHMYIRLSLAGTAITDAGLKALKDCVELDLRGTAITDAGMKALADDNPGLNKLNLDKTAVGDAGLMKLAGLQYLCFITTGAAITPQGIDAFQAKRPSWSYRNRTTFFTPTSPRVP